MSGSEAVTEKPSHSLGRLRDAVARHLTIGRSVIRGGRLGGAQSGPRRPTLRFSMPPINMSKRAEC